MNVRVKKYYEVTEPIIKYYEDKNVLYHIDSSLRKDIVFQNIKSILEESND